MYKKKLLKYLQYLWIIIPIILIVSTFIRWIDANTDPPISVFCSAAPSDVLEGEVRNCQNYPGCNHSEALVEETHTSGYKPNLKLDVVPGSYYYPHKPVAITLSLELKVRTGGGQSGGQSNQYGKGGFEMVFNNESGQTLGNFSTTGNPTVQYIGGSNNATYLVEKSFQPVGLSSLVDWGTFNWTLTSSYTGKATLYIAVLDGSESESDYLYMRKIELSQATPVISSFSPGWAGHTESVSLIGAQFDTEESTYYVNFLQGSYSVNVDATSWSESAIGILLSTGNPTQHGDYTVTVNAYGKTSASSTFRVVGTPIVSSISPNLRAQGYSVATTINGSEFSTLAKVSLMKTSTDPVVDGSITSMPSHMQMAVNFAVPERGLTGASEESLTVAVFNPQGDFGTLYHGFVVGVPPEKPSGGAGTAASTSSIVWSWSYSVGIKYPTPQFVVLNETMGAISLSLDSSTTSFTENDLLPNTQYTRYVGAYNKFVWEGVISDAIARYTWANPPSKLRVTRKTGLTATIYWDAGTGGNSAYSVERAADVNGSPGPYVYIRQFSDNLTRNWYTDIGLEKETTYWYRVRGYNGNGVATTPTNEVQVTTLSTAGDPRIIGNVIAPGKASSAYIYYDVITGGHVEVKIYSVSGELVRTLVDSDSASNKTYEIIWDGTNDRGDKVGSGVYLMSIRTPDSSVTSKIVLVK